MNPSDGFMVLDPTMPAQTLSVPVVAGHAYQIQLIGNTSETHAFHLLATNSPIINKQPRSQTVYANASAVFYVFDSGVSPRTYQWRLGTNNLYRETTPMLALDNIDQTMVGQYFVVISNAFGSITSAPATLNISQSTAAASLQVVGNTSNSMTFNLSGESGRSYRVESSTNLIDWQPEASFPISAVTNNEASVLFATDTPLPVTVTNNLTRKFFRARPYRAPDADAEICINHLRENTIVKMLWHRDTNPIAWSTPTMSRLQYYYAFLTLPMCPLDPSQTFGSSYNIFSLKQIPSCNMSASHILEENP